MASQAILEKWREWFQQHSQRSKSTEVLQETLSSSASFFEEARKLAPKEAALATALISKEQVLPLTQAEAAGQELDGASAAQVFWAGKRGKGFRRIPAALQKFMTRSAEFLEAYSGVVEIVKQAESQYGGLAYSTLSLFLLVAVNKSKREETIENTLTNLRWDLDRVGKLERLVPGENVARLVSNIYSNVIKFARYCTLYFSKAWFKRMFENAFKPPKLFIDDKVAKMKNDVTELLKEADIASHERIQILEARQEEFRDLQTGQNLIEVRDLIQIKSFAQKDLAKYRDALYDPSGSSRKYQKFSFDTLSREEQFQDWLTSEHSSLLLLYGMTLNTRSGFSWISPAALELNEALQNKSLNVHQNSLLLSCFAHEKAWMPPNEKTQSHLMLSRMILQALEEHQFYLLDAPNLAKLKSQIQDPDFKAPVPKLPCLVLGAILDSLPERPTYIVFDRVDACNCSAVALIESLVELTRGRKSRVKVFTTVGGLGHFDVRDITGVSGADHLCAIRLDQQINKKN